MTFKEDLCSEMISSLALRNAIAIDKHTIARAAIALMRCHSLGCAVLVDQNCRPLGMFTEQSIIRMLVEGAPLDTTPVHAFAQSEIAIVRTRDPILAAWKAVVKSGQRYVCVTNDQGQLVGLSGQRSLAEYVCDCFAKQIAVQRLGSAPWMLEREGA